MSYLAAGPPKSVPEKLVETRDSPAVMKLSLATYRSRLPDAVLLAFEGPDDKIVYAQWINRIRQGLRYEPLVCRGKTAVLNLADVAARDLTGDGSRVYCFVDRDFDDLRGRDTHPHLFITRTYSIENVLVESQVLENLLINEFHCEGHPDTRSVILELFETVYDAFLKLSRDFNLRLFIARKLGIVPTKQIPEKLSTAITVKLAEVGSTHVKVEDVIVYSVKPSADDDQKLLVEFDNLSARERYRGKWALGFFDAWLKLLAAERNEPMLGLFKDCESRHRARSAELVVSNFASKSALPDGLEDFVMTISDI